MDKFGFIVHPVRIEDFYRYPGVRLVPKRILEAALTWLPPFKVSEIKGIRSITGKEIRGYIIACPLLPKQMLKLDTNFVLNKIIAAGKIAQNLGAKIVGLGGYTSVIGDKGLTIAKHLDIPVTSGNSYTAWSVVEAITRSAKDQGVDLRKSTVAIIGATGSIGSLCTKKLSYDAPKIIITARHREKLEALKAKIAELNPIEVVIEDDAHKAVKDADIVIVTTSAPEALLEINEFKTGAIVCDVSVPKNVSTGDAGSDKGITLIKGGLIKLPSDVNFGTNIGLPRNIVYACMAETILLTLEGNFTSYSLGGDINPDKFEAISALGTRHGFEVVC